MTRIAFIGLGSMGRPMARALLAAGHAVHGHDIAAASREAAAQFGLRGTDRLRDAVADAEVVITMLPTGTHVAEAYLGDDGILALAPKDALLIDSSTIDVATSRRLHAEAAARGFAFLDAPVTGAVPAAEQATLTFMVGGDAATRKRAEPVLLGMGKAVIPVGGPGAGHAMKICNNMMTGMSMLAISEVFALGEKFGLDDQTLFDVVSRGSGACWALTTYCPVPGPVPTSPANRDYRSSFSMRMMLKDMRLSQALADQTGASTPLAASAAAVYQAAVNHGMDALDFSAIYRFVAGSQA